MWTDLSSRSYGDGQKEDIPTNAGNGLKRNTIQEKMDMNGRLAAKVKGSDDTSSEQEKCL
jgi:hypothetical protein